MVIRAADIRVRSPPGLGRELALLYSLVVSCTRVGVTPVESLADVLVLRLRYDDPLRLYLSSYRLGDHERTLVTLVGRPGAKAAVCINALDNVPSESRANILRRELDDMRRLGFLPEELDLRESFGREGLLERMRAYDIVWVSGGNVFLLVKAMKQSGFDHEIQVLLKADQIVYAGYSAAFCVLAPSLRGMELVDDLRARADGYAPGEAWEGLGLIDFHPVVHFRSDHSESTKVEREYDFVVANGIHHETFRDGDVYVVRGDDRAFLRG